MARTFFYFFTVCCVVVFFIRLLAYLMFLGECTPIDTWYRFLYFCDSQRFVLMDVFCILP